jgi:hypothetical protein
MGKRCEEKIKFRTAAECYRRIIDGSKRGNRIDWYVCPYCSFYHLTHRK